VNLDAEIPTWLGLNEDEFFELADKIQVVMETKPVGTGWIPSVIARRAGCRTHVAAGVLDWMADHVYIDTTGNGAWTHYHRRSLAKGGGNHDLPDGRADPRDPHDHLGPGLGRGGGQWPPAWIRPATRCR